MEASLEDEEATGVLLVAEMKEAIRFHPLFRDVLALLVGVECEGVSATVTEATGVLEATVVVEVAAGAGAGVVEVVVVVEAVGEVDAAMAVGALEEALAATGIVADAGPGEAEVRFEGSVMEFGRLLLMNAARGLTDPPEAGNATAVIGLLSTETGRDLVFVLEVMKAARGLVDRFSSTTTDFALSAPEGVSTVSMSSCSTETVIFGLTRPAATARGPGLEGRSREEIS